MDESTTPPVPPACTCTWGWMRRGLPLPHARIWCRLTPQADCPAPELHAAYVILQDAP